MFNFLGRAALVALAAVNTVNAIPTISVKGSKFFAGGQQFFLKGVAYQGTPEDPLVDTKQCQMDADLMKTLGTNSIRVYHVNPWVSHDGCMKAFADAGIYIWVDLDTFNSTIQSMNPYWTEPQFTDFTRVMDAMHGYDNLGGFWIGNEVIFTNANSNAAPYVRAATADMKAYRDMKGYRKIPIGYSAADIAELRPSLQNYLACDGDQMMNIDFFGLNSYEWCGDSSYETSGYANLQAMSLNYSIPIFFSETGCNQPSPRSFSDQAAIFGPHMIDTWSGTIIYEWVEEVNKYGLVNYGPDGKIYDAAPTPIQPDFNNLANQWKNVKPTGIAESAYTPSFKAPACPMATGGWGVNGNVPMPTLARAMISKVAANVSPATPVAEPMNGMPSTSAPIPPSSNPSGTPSSIPSATPSSSPASSPTSSPLSPPASSLTSSPLSPPASSPTSTPLSPPASSTTSSPSSSPFSSSSLSNSATLVPVTTSTTNASPASPTTSASPSTGAPSSSNNSPSSSASTPPTAVTSSLVGGAATAAASVSSSKSATPTVPAANIGKGNVEDRTGSTLAVGLLIAAAVLI